MTAWWRPAAYSAAAAAAVAALFNPLPALADPSGLSALTPSVPDTGSRPIPSGAIQLPGQASTTSSTTGNTATSTSTTTLTNASLSGATNPTLVKIQNGRNEISTLGDQLIQLGVTRDNAKLQQDSAQQQYARAQADVQAAQQAVNDAASQDVMDAAGMPDGAFDSGLLGLDDLAHLQRGEGASSETASRQLSEATTAFNDAGAAQSRAQMAYTAALAAYNKLNTTINTKQAAQQKLENANQALIAQAEASQNATDTQIGTQYVTGSQAGRSADPRAIQALEFALSQRGKPYVWSTEGPNTYDCSGLTYRSYHLVGFPLERVSRDQYWQTRNKVVDKYSLLPGDLIFFSYSNSWQGIHHVAMYAGNGMMVEAPRTGLNVRLVPVRWNEMFEATRVFGSVEGSNPGPDLGTPDPQPTETTPHTTPPTSHPTTTPSSHPTTPSSHPTTPSSHPTTPSSHPTTPSSHPTTPSSHPTTPSGPPSSSTPTTPTPTTDPPASSSSPSASSSGSGTASSPSGSSTSPSGASASASKSATVSKGASESASPSSGTK